MQEKQKNNQKEIDRENDLQHIIDEIAEYVLKVGNIKTNSIDINRNLFEYGFTSLILMKFFSMIYEKYNVLIQFSDAAEITTIYKIAIEIYNNSSVNADIKTDSAKENKLVVDENEIIETSYSVNYTDMELSESEIIFSEHLISELVKERIALYNKNNALCAKAVKKNFTKNIYNKIDRNKIVLALYLKDKKIYPLSYSQKRYWIASQLINPQIGYNIPICLFIEGIINKEALIKSIKYIHKKHDLLRAKCPSIHDNPIQIIDSINSEPIIIEKELTEFNNGTGQIDNNTCDEIIKSEIMVSINPSKDPLIQYKLFQFNNQKLGLLINIHHVIMDIFSVKIFLDEIKKIYKILIKNLDEKIPDEQQDIQYIDYIFKNNINQRELEANHFYWFNYLKNAPSHTHLLLDYPRPLVNGNKGNTLEIIIDEKIYKEFNVLLNSNKISNFVGFYTIIKTAIFKWIHQNDLIIGITIQNRDNEILENIIGDFTSLIPIRSIINNNDTFLDFLKKVNVNINNAIDKKNIDFDHLLDIVKKPPISINPVFNVHINQVIGLNESVDDEVNIHVKNYYKEVGISLSDLRFDLIFSTNDVILSCEYNTEIFKEVTINKFLNNIEGIIKIILKNPNIPIHDIPFVLPNNSSIGLNGKNIEEFNDYPIVENKKTHHSPAHYKKNIPDHPFITIEQLKSIYANYLGMEIKSIDIDEKFFEMGGNSMLAVKISNEISETLYSVSPTEILQYPSIRQLYDYLISKNVAPINNNIDQRYSEQVMSDDDAVTMEKVNQFEEIYHFSSRKN